MESMMEQDAQPGQTNQDPVVEQMARVGLPLTRTNYISMAYPDRESETLTAEEEEMLPPEIRK